MRQVGFVALAAIVAGWSWPVVRADANPPIGSPPPPAAALEPAQLLRVAAVHASRVNGEGILTVAFEPLEGGWRVGYVIPNVPGARDPKAVDPLPGFLDPATFRFLGDAFNPLPEVFGALKTLGIGAVVRVRIAPGEQGLELAGLEPVPHLPGEDTPTGYVLAGTSTIVHENKDYTLVRVTKLSRPSTFVIPLGTYDRRQGRLLPDTAVTAVLAGAAPGTVLDVELDDREIAGHPVIRSLREYRPTRVGRILELAQEARGTQVRIQVGEETLTLPWRPRTGRVPDPKDDPESPLKVGRTVSFTTTAEEPHWLESVVLDGSFYKNQGSGEYVVISGGVTLTVRADSRSASRVSTRGGPPGGQSVGSALVRSRELQNQLLLDSAALKQLDLIRLPDNRPDQSVGPALDAAVAATDSEQRFKNEQALYALVQDYAARVEASAREQDDAVRMAVTPEQYEAVRLTLDGDTERVTAAAPPRAVLEPEALLRITGFDRISLGLFGSEVALRVALEPLEAGQRLSYLIPNQPRTPDRDRFDPLPDVVASLRRLGIGATVRVRIAPVGSGIALVGIKPVAETASRPRSVDPSQSIDKDERRGSYSVTSGGVTLEGQPHSARGIFVQTAALEGRYPGCVLVRKPEAFHALLLEPEQLERLGEIPAPRIEPDEALGQALDALADAARPEQRMEAKERLFGLLQDHAARVEAACEEEDQAARKILTADQYEVLAQDNALRWRGHDPATSYDELVARPAPSAATVRLHPSAVLRIVAVAKSHVMTGGSSDEQGLLHVVLEPLDGGTRVEYSVPNQPGTPDAGALEDVRAVLTTPAPSGWPGEVFNPLPQVVLALKQLGPGAVVRVQIAASEHGIALVGIEPAPCQPGEDTPNGYVFVRTSSMAEDGSDQILVHLTKYGRPRAFVVPEASDPAFAAVLSSAKPGAVLDVRLEDRQIAGYPVLRYLGEYRPTRIGRFLGLRTPRAAPATVRILMEQETLQLALPATASEVPLLKQSVLSRLVPGRTVKFTTTGGKVPLLRSIELDGSHRAGRGGLEVTCAGRTYELSLVQDSDTNVVPRLSSWADATTVYPGAALALNPPFGYQLLLEPGQMKKLEAIGLPRIEIDPAVGHVMQALAAASPQERAMHEQVLYDLVQDYAARLEAAYATADAAVRRILRPAQYQLLSRASRSPGGMSNNLTP